MKIVSEIISRATVTITVQNGPTPNIRDYVALYLPKAPNYFVWSYLNNGRDAAHRPPKGLAAGTVKFTNLALGKFEARLYALTDAGVATLKETTPVVTEANPGSNIFVTDNKGIRVRDNNRVEVTI